MKFFDQTFIQIIFETFSDIPAVTPLIIIILNSNFSRRYKTAILFSFSNINNQYLVSRSLDKSIYFLFYFVCILEMALPAPNAERDANFYFYFSIDRQEISSSSRSVNAVRKDWIQQNIFQRNLEGNFNLMSVVWKTYMKIYTL